MGGNTFMLELCEMCNGLGEVYMDRIKISNHYEKLGGKKNYELLHK